MRAFSYVLLLLIGALLLISVLLVQANEQQQPEQERLTPEQCQSYGFVSEELPCGVCKAFSTFVSDSTLISQCNACCTTSLDGQKKYKKALLEVCHMRLQTLPELQHFISKRANLFKNLRISYKYNANPSLSMEQTNSAKVDKMPIDKWSNDDIFNYLSQSIN